MASACGIRGGEDKAKTVIECLQQSRHVTEMQKTVCETLTSDEKSFCYKEDGINNVTHET